MQNSPKKTKQMAKHHNGRHCVTMTCSAELYEQILEHCRREDLPVAVFCRTVVRQAVEQKTKLI